LELDTSKEILKSINDLVELGKIKSSYVIMSHLACADDSQNDATILQVAKFHDLVEAQTKYSLANSAGIFGWPATHYDWVRPGISMYGSSPLLHQDRDSLNLKPSMELVTEIISLRTVKQGETIGYGGTWRAPKDTTVAIIGCGYADCYPRVLYNNCYVWLNNKLCQIVGRVSMDTMAIDCSSFVKPDSIKIGDKVELWGANISIDQVARDCGTISNELYCRVTSRVEKLYV
jgi:alanine racemase